MGLDGASEILNVCYDGAMMDSMSVSTVFLSVPPMVPQVVTDVEYVVVSAEDLERPYRIILENDDVTPMDFVVMILQAIFTQTFERAMHIMLEAHAHGHAYVMSLPFEEAQQRVYAAQSTARLSGYPLSLYLEPEG